ncbi:hypothetical protein H4S14_000888 [Agrobacterium vitis]|nr:hypothetical protein [Agrobacterium vitis]MBE1437161.1 hypothetical protein [Agrobacterium vitis]
MSRSFLILAMGLLSLTGAALPPDGPVPNRRPDMPQAAPSATHANSDKSKGAPQAATPPDPAMVPTPQPSPTKPEPAAGAAPIPDSKPAVAPEPEQPVPPPPIMAENPQAYGQCIKALTEAGATFTEKPRIDDGDGCGIDKPIEVSQIMPGISLAPSGTLRCEAALELSQWVKTVVIPTAEQAMPDKGRLTAINQASTYICRKRNSLSEGKISEHARGNAIDIAGLTFEKGTVPMTIAPEKEPTMDGAFQRTLNASACLYFTTVLAPGSDETHRDHMHLDLIKRNHDARYCRDPK